MANYAVDPALLLPWLPPKTELDLWNGKCYVSLVGFMFLDNRVMGMKIPFHINFEEINLRFYVKHTGSNGTKRGVVFIREIVPRAAISIIANLFYRENYITLPTHHSWITSPGALNVEYKWKKKDWNVLRISTEKKPRPVEAGSEEEFITEHYWGYTKAGKGSSYEYEVEHPKWEVYPTRSFSINVDFGDTYGSSFAFLSKEKPASVFLFEGSKITVRRSKKI
jgi:uncharacterized protein YqjF (DUF2071 family)